MIPKLQAREKITVLDDLIKIREDFKSRGKTVVFTNGCFDLLHIGHVRYLEEAANKGDCLIVGINSDLSVAKIKGEGRPIIPENERAELLAALHCVDNVIIFHEYNPENIISKLKPDIHVKGGDYQEDAIPEAKIVARYGGKVSVVQFIPNHSTSIILKNILTNNPSVNNFLEH